MVQEYVIQNQGAVILESDGGFIVEEGLRSAQYLRLGYTEDVTSMTLLICKRKSPSHWHGMMGRLFLFRGTDAAQFSFRRQSDTGGNEDWTPWYEMFCGIRKFNIAYRWFWNTNSYCKRSRNVQVDTFRFK